MAHTKLAVTVTLLLMRHGLSCSNVLDGCMTHIENVDQAFQPHIFDAVDRELVDTPFDRAVGYGAADIKGDDCTLVLERPDQTTAKVRLHDAYRDPKLTDCGVELSKRAGVALAAVCKAGVGDVLNIATSPRDGAARLPRRRGARGAVPGRARALESGHPARQRAARAGRRVVSADGVARNRATGVNFCCFGGRRSRPALQQHASEVGPPLENKLDDDDGAAVVFVAGHGDYLRRFVVWTRSPRTTRCCGGVL